MALAVALAVMAAALTPAAAPKAYSTEVSAGSGRMIGDDTPAVERCFMTDDEINEDYENFWIEAALLSRAHVIEECEITHYCAEQYTHICGTGDGLTATGTKVTPYVSCAVDPRYIPYGSTVIVDFGDGELHYYVADDCGGAIKGNHIDLCVSTHAEANRLGTKTATVYWCEE